MGEVCALSRRGSAVWSDLVAIRSMPPQYARSETEGKVAQGKAGLASVGQGLWAILEVFPYLFRKLLAILISALQWAGVNVAQAIGTVAMIIIAAIYVDSVYDVRERLACFVKPSLCAPYGGEVRRY